MEITRNVHVTSSSLLFPLDINLGKLEITSVNNGIFSLIDVKRLHISDYVSIHVDTSNLTISKGNGFYSTLKFRGKIIITPKSNSKSIIASTADGNTTH